MSFSPLITLRANIQCKNTLLASQESSLHPSFLINVEKHSLLSFTQNDSVKQYWQLSTKWHEINTIVIFFLYPNYHTKKPMVFIWHVVWYSPLASTLLLSPGFYSFYAWVMEEATWGMNQWMKDLSSCVTLSNRYRSIKNKMKYFCLKATLIERKKMEKSKASRSHYALIR